MTVPGQFLITLKFNSAVAGILVPRGRIGKGVFVPRRVQIADLDRVFAKLGVLSVSRVHYEFAPWELAHPKWSRLKRRMDSTFLLTADPSHRTSSTALQHLRNTKAVEHAEPNWFAGALMIPQPAAESNWRQQIQLQQAWASGGKGDPRVTVAVIDSGVRATHPEFVTSLRAEPGSDVVDLSQVSPPFGEWFGDIEGPDSNTDDDFGHGTRVASLVAGRTCGVAPDCCILPVRALATYGSGQDRRVAGKSDDIARAIRFAADRGAQILNLSYGNAEAKQPGQNQVENNAIEAAIQAGCFIAAAMGNDGSGGARMFPAAYNNVCGVAAVDENEAHWPQSQTGMHCDLSAPGVDIRSANLQGSFDNGSGTSFACAIVSGVAALAQSASLKTKGRALTGAQLNNLLAHTAKKEWTSFASRTPEFGFGLVDAARVIASVQNN